MGLTDLSIDLSEFIKVAISFVEATLTGVGLTEDILFLITQYLAAHFATLSREGGALATNSLGEATERYHNIYGAGLKATRYGQQAIAFDVSGTLASLTAMADKPARNAQFGVI